MPTYSVGNLNTEAVTLSGIQTITGQKIFSAPAGDVDIIVKASSSKTANLQEWRDANNNVLARIANNGTMWVGATQLGSGSGPTGEFVAAGNPGLILYRQPTRPPDPTTGQIAIWVKTGAA